MQPASKFLCEFAAAPNPKHSTVGSFVKQLGSRSFALILFILSLPQAGPWPMPPGMSAIMGLPMLFIALQLMCGKDTIWLPRLLTKKSFTPRRLKTIARKIVPYLKRLEKILHPRLTVLFSPLGMRLIGFVIAVMALVMSLPIPGGNFLPAFGVCLLSLAILARDGLLAILSLIFCGLILVLMYHLFGVAFEATADWLSL